MSVRVTCAFDGGNGELVEASDPSHVVVRMKKDVGGRFMQWFYFRVSGCRDTSLVVRIENAGDAAFKFGYVGYRAVASTDRKEWLRVPTEFEGGVLTIRYEASGDHVYFAYFAPYSLERHADRIAEYGTDPRVRLETVGMSLDGRDIDLVKVGTGRHPIWVIARQHPGETMAEHWMDGFVDRLLGRRGGVDGAVARTLLEQACFYIVPNMNPDGSYRGHLRTNASGANLNREWLEPTLARSPEVYWVRHRMGETGVDLCLDVHGDEELPYNFIAGSDGIPSLTAHQVELLADFRGFLVANAPDFQVERGYPPAPKGHANLRMCTNYVAETFHCLAMTLEQPFKDAANNPDERVGWSPARAGQLGSDCVDAIHHIANRLRRTS